ncbi:unnamed protein product [Linum trigynum]|uniref:Reverse transcriptase domain-containing protein n=1 Tax=Linum trigynum TaxID=586398 RepID=A0AAV2GIH9_9ROSI
MVSCFQDPSQISLSNATLLALLAKVESPVNMAQFRPIGLCNVSYKVIAKCLANRLQKLMPDLVDETQTRFVPKRHITYNIIILQEVIHTMSLKRGKKGLMVLKVDLAKAYNRINWSFLRSTLEAARLSNDFIELVMACITTIIIQVLWHESCSEDFKPTRGLRQGCPLSPYIFTLCMERLSHCIKELVASGSWNPIYLTNNGTPLTHLFFADDLVLFGEASVSQSSLILDCLERFCWASGEQISKDKSCIFFSKNTTTQTKNRISRQMGISHTNNMGKYLGVPVIHGRFTQGTYKYILEKLDKRLIKLGWTFLNHEDQLWIKILHEKYVKQNNNGCSVRFWQDPWLADGIILQDHITRASQLPN